MNKNPNYEQFQNLNKPKSFRVGSARLEKITNKMQKMQSNPNYEQTQNLKKKRKIADRLSSVRSAKTTGEPNPKSNQSKTHISGWWNCISVKQANNTCKSMQPLRHGAAVLDFTASTSFTDWNSKFFADSSLERLKFVHNCRNADSRIANTFRTNITQLFIRSTEV